MKYNFTSIQNFFQQWQTNYINLLSSCGLLNRFTPDCKKLLIYLFLTNINKQLENKSLLFYHDGQLDDSLEIFQYFSREKFTIFFNKVTKKIRSLTGKIFFIPEGKKNKVPSTEYMFQLDGCIQDEILTLSTFQYDSSKVKKFLSEVNLKDIFNDMTVKCA
jgi:hypothetical protein